MFLQRANVEFVVIPRHLPTHTLPRRVTLLTHLSFDFNEHFYWYCFLRGTEMSSNFFEAHWTLAIVPMKLNNLVECRDVSKRAYENVNKTSIQSIRQDFYQSIY